MSEDKEQIIQRTPVIIRIISIFILVIAIVGFSFFFITGIYQLYNPEFLLNISNTINQNDYLIVYIFIQAILYIGYILSSIFILKLKKAGLILFYSAFALSLINELVFDNLLITNQIIGLLIGLILIIYFRKFN